MAKSISEILRGPAAYNTPYTAPTIQAPVDAIRSSGLFQPIAGFPYATQDMGLAKLLRNKENAISSEEERTLLPQETFNDVRKRLEDSPEYQKFSEVQALKDEASNSYLKDIEANAEQDRYLKAGNTLGRGLAALTGDKSFDGIVQAPLTKEQKLASQLDLLSGQQKSAQDQASMLDSYLKSQLLGKTRQQLTKAVEDETKATGDVKAQNFNPKPLKVGKAQEPISLMNNKMYQTVAALGDTKSKLKQLVQDLKSKGNQVFGEDSRLIENRSKEVSSALGKALGYGSLSAGELERLNAILPSVGTVGSKLSGIFKGGDEGLTATLEQQVYDIDKSARAQIDALLADPKIRANKPTVQALMDIKAGFGEGTLGSDIGLKKQPDIKSVTPEKQGTAKSRLRAK